MLSLARRSRLTILATTLAATSACIPRPLSPQRSDERRSTPPKAAESRMAPTPGVQSPSAPLPQRSWLPEPSVATSCYKAEPEICRLEDEILRLTNEERHRVSTAGYGVLAPLKGAPQSSFIARQWSMAQATNGRISHSGFPTARTSAALNEFGSAPRFLAENVAMNSMAPRGELQDAQIKVMAKTIFEQWRRNPGHYRNMVGNFPSLGVGVYYRSGGVYATQLFSDE